MAASRDDRVDEAIAEYLAGCDAGTPPDRAAFLEKYPDLADSLREFLDDHARMRAAGPLAGADETAAMPAGHPPSVGDAETLGFPPDSAGLTILGTVRYIGDYELRGEIARGGMGVVFRARQVSLNREVALKMILAGELAGPTEVARFRAEAEAAANLDHPNIIPIYEVGEHLGHQYFAMKLVTGGSLADRLRGDAAAAPRALAVLVSQVCRAVDFAHRRGVLHRDLKPGNILLDADGTPYVTDFGLAKKVEGDDGLTRTGAVVGTPAYMPPEQARGEKRLTTAADVYALGAILYEVLAGRPPFRATTVLDTLLLVLDREAPDPRTVNPTADRDLTVIALKCLNKDPLRRYDSAAALADDIDRWLRGEPILARPVSRGERAAKWVRRNPVVAGLLAAVVLLLVGVTTASVATALHISGVNKDLASAREAADLRAAEGRALLARFLTRQGAEAAADLGSALPWFAAALEADPGDPDHERDYRVRLGAFLRHTPPLLHFHAEEGVEAHPEVSADGRWMVTVADRVVTVTDIGSGQPVGPPVRLPGRCSRATLSPDGERVMTYSAADTVNQVEWAARMWDARTGRELYVFPPDRYHGDTFSQVPLFSPDGRLVFTLAQLPPPGAKADGPVNVLEVWTAADGKPVSRFEGKSPYFRVSVEARRVAVLDTDKLRVFDLDTGKPIGPAVFPGEPLTRTVAIAPDGSWVAAAGTLSRVRFWKLPSMEPIGSPLDTGWGEITHLEVSPDGDNLAVVSNPAGTRIVQVWSVRSPVGRVQVGRPIRHKADVRDVTFSPDGRWLATSALDGTARVWWADTTEPVTPFLPHLARRVDSARFTPDGRQLVTTASELRQSGEVRVWALGIAPRPGSVSNPDWPPPRWVSPDGLREVKRPADDNAVRQVVTLADGRPAGPPFRYTESLSYSRFHPDGVRVMNVTTGKTLVWDSGTGQLVFPPIDHGGVYNETRFSPDGRRILTTAAMGEVKLWDSDTGDRVGSARHGEHVFAATFSPDSRRLATGGIDGMARVWDAGTLAPVGSGLRHEGPLQFVKFSPDGRRLATVTQKGDDRTALARVWDLVTGRTVGPAIRLPESTSPTFSPDGRWLLTVAFHNKDASFGQVWEVTTGLPVGPATAIPRDANEAAFRRDGRGFVVFDLERAFAFDLSPTDWPAADLRRWCEVVSGRRVDPSGNVTPLTPDQARSAWADLAGRAREGLSGAEEPAAGWHLRQATGAAASGQHRAVVFHLDRARAAGVPDLDVSAERGTALLHLERWAGVDTEFTALLRRDPGHTAALTGRGTARLKLRRPDAALADFAAALEREPDRTDALLGRGLVRADRGQWDDAAADLTRLATTDRLESPGCKALAYVHAARGDGPAYAKACRDAITAIPPDPSVVEAFALRPSPGQDYSAALMIARVAAAEEPNERTLRAHGALLLRAGDLKDALAALEKAAATKGGDPRTDLYLALAHDALKQPAPAAAARVRAEDWHAKNGGKLPNWDWQDRLELTLLRRETEGVGK